MTARVVMVQGTASSVGKSVIAAGLCRIFAQDGYSVAPFKALNMSNNSFVCADGGEIGRAQAVQAEAAGAAPIVEMNPILLKPEGDSQSQFIILGRPEGCVLAGNFYTRTQEAWSAVVDSLQQLISKSDVVVIEGAGSPVELNLVEGDIANMPVARHANASVLLVGDIDRGGIFASLLGTVDLLDAADRDLVAGLVVNKFRGDLSLFSSGVEILEDRSGIPVLGVVPFHDLRIAEEDAVALDRQWKVETSSDLDIAVAKLPRISNFDDFQPLENESGTSVRYVGRGDELGNPDVVILPGTKSTIADLEFLRGSGLADAVVRHHRAGGRVIGICGGFQMLGIEIHDPDGAESRSPSARGLELLDAVTVFAPAKQTSQVRAVFCEGTGLLADLGGVEIDAYEVHMGKTKVRESPLLRIQRRDSGDSVIADGAVSDDGRVIGTYMHGLFDDPRVRAALRSWTGAKPVALGIHSREFRQEQYDALAALLRKTLRLDKIKAAMGL